MAMTIERIENVVSGRVDSIDYHYLNSGMSDAEYDAEMVEIDSWAEEQYEKLGA